MDGTHNLKTAYNLSELQDIEKQVANLKIELGKIALKEMRIAAQKKVLFEKLTRLEDAAFHGKDEPEPVTE